MKRYSQSPLHMENLCHSRGFTVTVQMLQLMPPKKILCKMASVHKIILGHAACFDPGFLSLIILHRILLGGLA